MEKEAGDFDMIFLKSSNHISSPREVYLTCYRLTESLFVSNYSLAEWFLSNYGKWFTLFLRQLLTEDKKVGV